MHAKTDSEVTSLAPSSPRRPDHPAYFVRSPSHDGGDAAPPSAAAAPPSAALSPAASPPRHSHGSSPSSRFSGALLPLNPPDLRRGRGGRGGGGRSKGEAGGKGGWRRDRIEAIEEEGFAGGEEEGEGSLGEKGFIRRRCYCLVFIGAFIALFSFFALILWGASRSQTPQITMKSVTFENFIVQAGTDASLVPTDMATLNSTVRFAFRNTGTFFGVHVAASPFDLDYNQLTLASGDMKNFYQSRKSRRSVDVVVVGKNVPLYGGGPSLTSSPGKPDGSVAPLPLSLSFVVRSQAYVLGRLVEPKFDVGVQCSVVLDPAKLGTPVSLAKSCQCY